MNLNPRYPLKKAAAPGTPSKEVSVSGPVAKIITRGYKNKNDLVLGTRYWRVCPKKIKIINTKLRVVFTSF